MNETLKFTETSVRRLAAQRTIIVMGPLPPPIHGAAQVTSASAIVLREDGWRVTVVDTSVADGTNKVAYHLARIRAHLRAARTLLRLRKAHERTLYIAGAGGGGLWYQLIVATLGNLLGYRIAFHHHSFAYLHRRMLTMRLILRLPLNDGCHIALCGLMKQALRDRYRTSARIEVLSNSDLVGNPPPAERPHQIRDNFRNVTFGHLSNLTVEKGLAEVLRTLELLLEAGLPVSLVLAGPTKTAEAAALVADASTRFGTSIRYMGGISQATVGGFMAQLDAFLFPSQYRNEAEPLVVLQALEAGIPVFAYDIGCLSERIGSMGITIPFHADFATTVLQETLRILAETESAQDTKAAFARWYQAENGRRTRVRQELTPLLLGQESE